MTRLTVRYARPEELVADHQQQMARGGLLVRGAPPAGLALFADVELEIAADFGPLVEPERLRAQVVQIVAGIGVAVTFATTARLRDAALQAAAAPVVPAPLVPPKASPLSTGQATAEKIQRALHGNKDERSAILRENNRMLHPYVLKNPHFGLDEVQALAKMRTVSPELLQLICDRKEWAQRPDIAIALVRNPKTPIGAALRLLDYVGMQDLRQLAKDGNTRPPIQTAARKRVLG